MNQLQAAEHSAPMPLSAELQEKVLLGGDLSKLSSPERLCYLKNLCQSLGLNPLSRPFEYITLNGKLTLYARKDCTEQLRKVNNITIDKLDDKILKDSIYVVTAHGTDGAGRHDISTGAVNIGGLKGDALANAIMKAETKSKRRLTLSLAGLGMLDEAEIETIPANKDISETYQDTIDLLAEAILESTTLDELKTAFKGAYAYAVRLKDQGLVDIFKKYKDAKKEEIIAIQESKDVPL